jgi:hypothetical protein
MEKVLHPPRSPNEMVVLTKEDLASMLTSILPPIVDIGIKNFKETELQERFLSPEEACKLFVPAISRPTIDAYAEKGYFKKYYLEARTWFKYREVVAALKSIKKYSRKELSENNQYLK